MQPSSMRPGRNTIPTCQDLPATCPRRSDRDAAGRSVGRFCRRGKPPCAPCMAGRPMSGHAALSAASPGCRAPWWRPPCWRSGCGSCGALRVTVPVSAPRIAIQFRNSTPCAPACFDQCRDRVARERVGIVHDRVHAELVELLVDEAGALAVELVRQPAGADDHHREVLLVGRRSRGRSSGRAQAARHRRQRMLHRVDRDRHDLHRPALSPGHISASGMVTA